MPTQETPTQRLASVLLGRPVHAWLTEQRDAGSSWRQIAADLRKATNGQIEVSYEAVRRWHGELVAA